MTYMNDDELDAVAERVAERTRPSTGGRVMSMFAGGGSAKVRLFGKADPKLYGMKPGCDMASIHDIAFSRDQINRMYGLGHKAEMALESVESDTRGDLKGELRDKGLTAREAEQAITACVESGYLVEVWDPDRREKVLIRR